MYFDICICVCITCQTKSCSKSELVSTNGADSVANELMQMSELNIKYVLVLKDMLLHIAEDEKCMYVNELS